MSATSPVAHPTLSNLLLVGNGGDAQGIRLRAGTQVSIDNAIVCGKARPLSVETTQTENALKNGTSTLTNVTISSDLYSEEGIYTNTDFLAGEGNSVDNTLSYTFDDIKTACTWMGDWTIE